MNIFYVMIGGSLGAALRYLSGIMLKKYFLSSFLTGSLLINILGSFLLAFFIQSHNLNDGVKLMITTGFMGAFTTYSTFSYEIFTQYTENSVYNALFYAFLMLVISFLATVLGFYIGKLVFQV
jgi:CrcB protein